LKRFTIFAGVNGAGKTSLYNIAFERNESIGLRVNLDEIVRGLGDWRDEKLQLESGKHAVRLVRQYLSEGVSFHQETTLAGRSIFHTIREAKNSGYKVILYYVGVDSPEIAKDRVRARVKKGGHGIEDAVIERRFTASLGHLRLVIPICDEVRFYDNSDDSLIKLLSIEQGEVKEYEPYLPKWLATVLTDMKVGVIKYRGCVGSVEHSAEDNCFFGKILGINDLYLFEGASISKLITAFHQAVDEHLDRE
jgi:predicted ABC-type ATPase